MKTDPQSLLSLDPSRPEDGFPIPWPPPGGLDPAQDPFARKMPVAVEELPVPLLALDLEEKEIEKERPPSRWGFTTDRAVVLSVLLHALLAFLFIVAPVRDAAAPDPD
ncbi:hypothetical protein EG835_13625, partial [bacterium]|nr:hypothetical protein [bacterium]